MIKAVVVVDDKAVKEELKTVHGLSIYVEIDDVYILFDLGLNPDVLEHNADMLGLDLELIDAAIVSHNHIAHVGGISRVGWISPYLKIYIPYGSMDDLGKIARSNSLDPEEVIDWVNPWRDVYITKPIHGPPWEHFLVVDTSKGLIVFSGCMHPGVDKVFSIITSNLGRKIYGVIGGFHLENAPYEVVVRNVQILFEKYGVEKVAPLHCSGELFKKLISEKYPGRLVEAGAGSIIELA